MEVSGKIKWLDETKTYGEKGFRKREVVITTEERYPQHILVEFIQDNCDLLDSFQIGQNVKIGQVLLIIEAMKTMNEITADKNGIVKKIYGKNQ